MEKLWFDQEGCFGGRGEGNIFLFNHLDYLLFFLIQRIYSSTLKTNKSWIVMLMKQIYFYVIQSTIASPSSSTYLDPKINTDPRKISKKIS